LFSTGIEVGISMMSSLSFRFNNASRELKLFALASFTLGMAYSLFDSVFNNYLNDRFSLSGFQRSFLEFPRELPGFLVVFVSAALWFLCSRRLGAFSMLFSLAGALLIGFASSSYTVMLFWLFFYSMGQHLFMPLASTIGLDLAKSGQDGRRLGQLNALRNIAAIAGSGLVFLGFRFLGMTFQHTFVLAAIGFAIAASLLFSMQRGQPKPSGQFLKLQRPYALYYLLNVLYGSRKQLFITFAPWVLVTIFHQPTQIIAVLITIGGVIGILFQPFLGWMIDHLGERVVLASEALLLVVVCLGYGFSRMFFSENVAFLIACVCYLLDQMLMSVSMARATYIKKIALDPADVQPALTVAVTIDHIFSISVALLGGAIWNAYGYQYVFLMGVGIAVINFFTALQVRIPAGANTASAT
jgi:predicted MFS family arabinose efflux permease